MSTNQTKGLLLATTTAFLWGFLAVALKIALNYFDSYTIVWFRFALAFMVLLCFYGMKKPEYLRVFRKPPLLLIAAAVLLGANYIGFMQGVNYAGPGATQVIIQAGPITLGVVGFLFFKEKVTWIRGIGFGIAAIGFGFFYYQQLKEFVSNSEALNAGVFWTLFAAWSWTGYAVLSKVLVRKWPAQQLNLIIYGLPALLFIPLADFSAFSQPLAWWVWLLMIFLGLNTVVAYGALTASFKYADANKISIIITMNPIITFILLELLIHFEANWFPLTSFPPMAYAGAALVLVGAILAVGKTTKKKSGSS